MSVATAPRPVRDQPASETTASWVGWVFAGTVLTSAFLLFQVQPLISKFILPWFGGSPAVWTTCMLFFQVVLFAGYSYAHLCQRLLSPKAQGVVHLGLLVLAFGLLHVEPSASWKPGDTSDPTWRILQLLLASVGLPYFALSATGPLLQAWFSRAYPGHSPYRLYALSNVGSLLALLSYPFVFEPAFDVLEQIWLWSLAFWLFVALCGTCAAWIARRHWRAAAGQELPPAAAEGLAVKSGAGVLTDAPPSWWRRLAWLLLPACASLMLLATTNHVCQDVAPIPILWVVPFSLYLLTFIISFDHERWYVRPLFSVATLALLYGVMKLPELQAVIRQAFQIPIDEKTYLLELSVYFGAMFCVCMICHGELVRLRPGPRYLTEFYLLISAGGALGGIFVSLIAPHVFQTFVEWKIAQVAGCGLAVLLVAWSVSRLLPYRQAITVSAVALLGLGGAAWLALPGRGESDDDKPLAITRNFYGVVSVWDVHDSSRNAHRTLLNGQIIHGRQFTAPERRNALLSYYPFYSGVGQTMEYFHDQPRKVAVIGLGVGTMAAYGQPGDEFRFYEINPAVIDMANNYFTFLKDCRGQVDVVLGDARLSLEREDPHGFHVLVVDAFSGDAIPTHLLTREAFEIYLKHLDPRGVLAIHITNRYLNLHPVVQDLADHFHLGLTRIDVPDDEPQSICRSHWLLVSRNQDFIDKHPPQVDPDDEAANKRIHPTRLWTDHYSNLFEILY